jgi:hypothetical protein
MNHIGLYMEQFPIKIYLIVTILVTTFLLIEFKYLELISNDTSSLVAEATATHVLLAFHMLFINILILNLLIAVFA